MNPETCKGLVKEILKRDGVSKATITGVLQVLNTYFKVDETIERMIEEKKSYRQTTNTSFGDDINWYRTIFKENVNE